MSEDEGWYRMAKLFERQGLLAGDPSFYQTCVLAGIIQYEAFEKMDERDEWTEIIWAIVRPEDYKHWKDNRERQRAEEGVDKVIYQGEENFEEALDMAKEFGLEQIDTEGKGLKQLKNLLKKAKP